MITLKLGTYTKKDKQLLFNTLSETLDQIKSSTICLKSNCKTCEYRKICFDIELTIEYLLNNLH